MSLYLLVTSETIQETLNSKAAQIGAQQGGWRTRCGKVHRFSTLHKELQATGITGSVQGDPP